MSAKSIFATLPRTNRGEPIVLGGDPKGKNFLYTNGNSVIIRDINNPAISDIYTEHSTQAIVAKYSPSGFYIASGDQSGKIRIWDTVNPEHILKAEYQPIAGQIKDIAWSPDSQRIAIGGEGRERFGHVFSMDTGTSVGEIIGQSKKVNSIDFRPNRPFRIATASEDTTLAFYHGPPFKFQFTIKDHSKFVNVVRYSPNGEVFISGDAGGLAFIYDGKSGEKIGELGAPAHKGGIYGLSFSPDSRQVLTVSGDKTAKIFDVGTSQLVTEFVLGSTVEDQQLGCLWQGPHILTVSLSGFINYLDQNNPSSPLKVIKGHNKPLTCIAVSDDKSTAFTGSGDGSINYWDVNSGDNDRLHGAGHSSQIQSIVVNGDTLVSCSVDDTVRFSSVLQKSYGSHSVKMDSQPRGLAVSKDGSCVIVACVNHVVVLENQRKLFSLKVNYEASCAAVHPGNGEVAVGGQDQCVHVYMLSSGTLTEMAVKLEHGGQITDVKYSPSGEYLAASDTNRRIKLYSLPNYEEHAETSGHTARVNGVNWSADSQFIASASLDTKIVVTPISNVTKKNTIKSAHPQNQVTGVEWINENTLISIGQDCNVKQWSI